MSYLHPNNSDTCKYCPGCKKVKSRKEFAKSSKNLGGSQGTCRKCQQDYRLKNAKKLKQKKREYAFKKKYGLTESNRQQMYINQGGCCALCEKPTAYKDIDTDHNHTTEKVRGLLCCRCNLGMGFIDDTNFVRRARKYIKECDKV